jgi:hypothetical protein
VRFGLTGATKYEEIGERYLRLYGRLRPTYIQQESILTIYRIMNVSDPKEIKERFDALEIRSLRHKLSAHGTSYLNFDTGETESHVPVRIDLGDADITYVSNAPPRQRSVNLSEAIEAHAKLMVDVLDIVVEKSIGTIFRGNIAKKSEFAERLSDLRVEKCGGYVFKAEGGPKLIVTFIGTPDVFRLGSRTKARLIKRRLTANVRTDPHFLF